MIRTLKRALALLGAAAVLAAATVPAEARGFKFRFSFSTPKVPAPAVQRAVPPLNPSMPRPVVAPVQPGVAAPMAAPAAAPVARGSFMSGFTGGLVGLVAGKAIARSLDSPEAYAGLVVQLLLLAAAGFGIFLLVMRFNNREPAYAAVPAGGGVAADRLSRVVDRRS